MNAACLTLHAARITGPRTPISPRVQFPQRSGLRPFKTPMSLSSDKEQVQLNVTFLPCSQRGNVKPVCCASGQTVPFRGDCSPTRIKQQGLSTSHGEIGCRRVTLENFRPTVLSPSNTLHSWIFFLLHSCVSESAKLKRNFLGNQCSFHYINNKCFGEIYFLVGGNKST